MKIKIFYFIILLFLVFGIGLMKTSTFFDIKKHQNMNQKKKDSSYLLIETFGHCATSGGISIFQPNFATKRHISKTVGATKRRNSIFQFKNSYKCYYFKFLPQETIVRNYKKTKNNFLPNFPIFYLKTCLFIPIFWGKNISHHKK